MAIQFAVDKAYEEKLYKCNLYKLLEQLQTEYIKKQDETFLPALRSVQSELEVIYITESQKAAFISRARYIKEGETNSKYFFGIGKRNYNKKTMYQVRTRNGTLTKDYSEILNEQSSFYKNLYTANENVHFVIQNTSGVFLSQQDREIMDAQILEDCIIKAITSMKPERTPGLDGFSCEF